MANATLLSAATADGAGTGASRSGATTVVLHKDSVLDGATVDLEICDVDTAAKYCPLNVQLGATTVDPDDGRREVQYSYHVSAVGTYYIRAFVHNAGTSTSITVVAIQ